MLTNMHKCKYKSGYAFVDGCRNAQRMLIPPTRVDMYSALPMGTLSRDYGILMYVCTHICTCVETHSDKYWYTTHRAGMVQVDRRD